MRHLIKKQVIELKLVTDIDIFSVQDSANRFYYDTILPALEKILNGLTDESHIIQMEKLEIDLGAIAWEDNQDSIKMNEIYMKIENAALGAVRQLRENSQMKGFREAGSINPEKTIGQNASEAWLYYIQNGYLPWNVNVVNEQWRLHVLETLAIDHTMVSKLRSLIDSDENALHRLMNDHPVSFLVNLMEALTATNQRVLPSRINEIEWLFEKGIKKPLQQEDKPVDKTTVWIWELFFKGTVKGLSHEDITEKIVKEKWTVKELDEVNLLKEDVPGLWPVIEIIYQGQDAAVNNSIDAGNVNKNVEMPVDRDLPNTVTGKRVNEDKNDIRNNEPGVTTEGIFASYAGLIILHPFLRHLFLRTVLIKNGSFINRAAQEKAIWLLYFVATGNESGEEHQLVVPKILCGYPLECSPDNREELDEASKAEAIDMIKAAIEQWPKLGNTSVEGFRETFLSRNGKMYKKNDEICFAIEPRSYDMLLDTLPWNLSMVKLPWRYELIKVEWR